MSDDEEPAVNISGGTEGGGVAAEFDPATADTPAEEVVDRLGELYWQKSHGRITIGEFDQVAGSVNENVDPSSGSDSTQISPPVTLDDPLTKRQSDPRPVALVATV